MGCERAAAVGLALAALVLTVAAPGARAATSSGRVAVRSKATAARFTPAAPSTPSHAPARAPAHAPAQAPAHAPAKAPARAPSDPPLGLDGTLSPEVEASASASPSGGDPLVGNGLGSPLCREGAGAKLSPTSARNCRSSGFEAARAPTGDYAFDVHINTSVTSWGNDLSASVQNAAQWGWMLLVAISHGVIVMLEWCYTVDLLRSSAMREVTNELRQAQATFTQPWLVLALAVAAILALYHGIVRRQVAETLGQTVLMGTMMLGGFWVIVNPLGTVGALDAWANEASLGTLGAVVAGTPDHPDRTFAESMESVFSGTIGGPWCYLEFGDVRWCEEPAQLDPRLQAAARRIVAKDRATIGSQSVAELRDAETNGELFLALPANGEQRNSINPYGPLENEHGLFNVLCGGSEEPCRGPTASEAEFRTQNGTAARVIGLLLIWIGVLGMVLLLGYLALHLLGAAIAGLFLLLLAPAAVIAPALGDGGRVAFRRWATWLLGAVCSKLIFSFLLGVVLLMQRTLMSVGAFGWWARWLLVSAMWWGAFLKRRQVLGFAHGEHRSQHAHGSLLRRAREKLQNPPELAPGARWVKRKLSKPPPSVEQRRKLAQAGGERAKGMADGQVKRTLEREHGEARALVQAEPEAQARISAKSAQLERVRGAHAVALGKAVEAKSAREAALEHHKHHGLRSPPERDRTAVKLGVEEQSHRRRAARLQGRMDRLGAEIAGERSSLTAARRTVADGEKAKRATGNAYTRAQAEEYARLLDAQAALPAGGARRGSGGGEQRDYAAIAGLAGYGRKAYEGLDGRSQRAARLEIDRELALRKELNATVKDVATGGEGSLRGRERRKTDRKFDRTLEQRIRDGGHELPQSARPKRSAIDAYLHDGSADRRSASTGGHESSVMRDAREVAARRKRQLGGERRR